MPRELTPIVINEETPQNKRIAWWFENTIIRAIKRLLGSIQLQIRQLLHFSITDFIEEFEQDLIPLLRPFVDTILSTEEIPEFIKAPIREAASGQHQAGLAILALIVPALEAGLSQGIGGPVGRITEAVFDQFLKSRLIDPGTLVALRQRNIIDYNHFRVLMWKNGLNDDAINALMQLAIPLFDDQTLTTLYWRGELSQDYVIRILKQKGYSDEQVPLWFQVRTIIPGPSDLVSMAVREAFNDNVARQFGYDEDYPAIAAEWAEKGGMKSEWFKKYWRAHWSLPGLVQVREMFHRGIITEDTVNIYLKAADYPSYWRKSIIQWMYQEITRVDVRRIYDLGLIGADEVYERYLKLGYNPDDSALMTEWTIAEYGEEERQLTKSDILSMYRDGILSVNESVDYLTLLNFKAHDIGLLLTHEDIKRQQNWEGKIISIVKEMFIGGIIDETEVFSELGKLDTPGAFIEQSIAVWRLEKKRKVVIPTTTQLRDMVLYEIISIDEFRLEMSNRGYSAKYIGWYEKLWFEE
jgi:hypothetical protein